MHEVRKGDHLLSEPTHGYTSDGTPVHAATIDHHPSDTRAQRFNKSVAVLLTKYVGTMWCFWAFCLLALCSLPAVLSAFSPFADTFPPVIVKASVIALIAWIAQTFIQLVLLPALMVGQSLQNDAADARAAKQFEDTEVILDRVDERTQGGVGSVMNEIELLKEALSELKARLDR